ncbi:T9SS type A sorting domain-containing protein [Flavobacterium piscinae]|uniref:T9SS type A sorting domain-containing protein n=1 Tax=Flavobacterium piscinae TaxID=2506424 RepID=A0A4Q1KVK7_9FLAO|nr:T9SS type A sorting domain-containing protein [Flavobacterium piscinae]MBC8883612.1 T9SS type A sorting domain-containing protein [Flavobacterium piscinae]RXR34268.1 T9SS type A sorting domain-containing protein [Flavobacterium piscinae]
MQTKIIKILFFFGIAFNGVSLHAITVVPLGNFAGGLIEFLITGTDAEGNTCLYEFDLVLPPCVEEPITTRPAQAIASDEIYKEPVLVLSPNPTQDTVSIKYIGYESDVELNVFDLTGRLMSTEQLPIKSNNLLLNVSSYPTGIYIVVIKQGEKLLSQHKLVKN